MNPLAELADLRDRLVAVEQLLADRPPASSSLTPSVLTFDDGVVGATFTGVVDADGLTLPAGATQSPPAQNRVEWVRSDGKITGDLFSWTQEGVGINNQAAVLEALAQGGSAHASVNALAGDVGSVLRAQVNVTADVVSKVTVQAGLSGNRLLIDSDGNAEYLRLPAAAKWQLHGPFNVTTSALAPGAEQTITVTHGLGAAAGTIVPVWLGNQDGAFSSCVGWRWAWVDANDIALTFHNLHPTANASAVFNFLLLTTT